MAPTSLDSLFELFEKHGRGAYLGDAVTKMEHSLLAGAIAERLGYDVTVVIGAFLHDVGHLLGIENGDSKMLGEDGADLGTANHETLGANYLEQLGFPSSVTDLVRHHVNAKRYKVATNKEYFAKLTPASVKTLRLQGGPMSDSEVEAFSKLPHFAAILAVREVDEQAKDPSAITPPISHFRKLCEDFLAKSASS